LIAQEHLVDATPEAEAAPTACNLVEKLQGSANLSPLPVLSPKLITEHQHGCGKRCQKVVVTSIENNVSRTATDNCCKVSRPKVPGTKVLAFI